VEGREELTERGHLNGDLGDVTCEPQRHTGRNFQGAVTVGVASVVEAEPVGVRAATGDIRDLASALRETCRGEAHGRGEAQGRQILLYVHTGQLWLLCGPPYIDCQGQRVQAQGLFRPGER
jgi:hypothetical protein